MTDTTLFKNKPLFYHPLPSNGKNLNSPFLGQIKKNLTPLNLYNKGGQLCTTIFWDYFHIRGEMNSYRFEISNRRENKFCSYEVKIRLHFKTNQYFDGHV